MQHATHCEESHGVAGVIFGGKGVNSFYVTEKGVVDLCYGLLQEGGWYKKGPILYYVISKQPLMNPRGVSKS